MILNDAGIVFLTPYATGGRGNVTTTQRIYNEYRQQGYEIEVFAYTQDAT